jgi:mono/diheme cytochrome c family protein
MSVFRMLLTAGALLAVAAAPVAAQTSGDILARGAYLVGPAGQCLGCHGANLRGGKNPVLGRPGVPWAKTILNLRGLKEFKTDKLAIAFFETSFLPGGVHALPPMPRYKFHEDDATAIVAYLRSLKK